MKIVRRPLIVALVLGFLAASLATEAQQAARVRRIGFIGTASSSPGSTQVVAFRRGLGELGWIEGQTVAIDYRWAEGNLDRLPALTAELVQAKVEIIVVAGSSGIRAARQATTTIPVVFVFLSDPVEQGFVASLARPGGNMTGVAAQYEELVTKQLQLLTEAIPKLSRVVILRHSPLQRRVGQAAETAARQLRLEPRLIDVTRMTDVENAFKTASRERVGAVHVMPSPFFNAHRARLAELALQYRLPAMYEFSEYVEDGGLMSYGPNIAAMFGRAASYVDRILKGANPGDLPIERPTTFELAINMKTAKALGLTIPASVLARADRVIE